MPTHRNAERRSRFDAAAAAFAATAPLPTVISDLRAAAEASEGRSAEFARIAGLLSTEAKLDKRLGYLRQHPGESCADRGDTTLFVHGGEYVNLVRERDRLRSQRTVGEESRHATPAV